MSPQPKRARLSWIVFAFAVSASSCSAKRADPAETAPPAEAAKTPAKGHESNDMKKTMKPATDDARFKRGPALKPSDKLTAYLESLQTIDGKPLRVRLPVVITLDPTGFGVDKATVGDLEVKLDDGALGISLVDRLRAACPNASTCAIWLEGHWRRPASFEVRKVLEPIADADLAAASYCQVQDL